MAEPARVWPVEDDLDDGLLTPAEEAALVSQVDEALAAGGETVSFEALLTEMGDEDLLDQ